MTVAVQKGLANMKNSLSALGFDTVYYGEYTHPVDAIVYKGISSEIMMKSEPVSAGSVFLVDCTNKTPAEVADILNRKLYTPLF